MDIQDQMMARIEMKLRTERAMRKASQALNIAQSEFEAGNFHHAATWLEQVRIENDNARILVTNFTDNAD